MARAQINLALLAAALLPSALLAYDIAVAPDYYDEIFAVTGRVFVAKTPERFTYDADGNMTSDGRFTYTWNDENRMVSASNAEVVVTYAYDHRGRMASKTLCASAPLRLIKSTTYLWDGWNIIRETRVSDLVSNVTYNLWGLDLDGTMQGAGGVGGLLAVIRDGETYIPTYDANGNISEYLSASDGSVAAHYDYSPFGEPLVASGPQASSFTHRFSTKPYCQTTGFCEYQYRKYRPDIGRWMSRDPIGENGGENLHAFCVNQPVIFYDKDGHAYFAIRGLGKILPPLEWSLLFPDPFMKLIVDIAADLGNVELDHEQLFFEDGKRPFSRGWSSDGYLDNESPKRYRKIDGGYDDCIMRIAMSMVNPDHYQLTWIGKRTKCNCQDYADALRRKYDEIKDNPEVKCNCKSK